MILHLLSHRRSNILSLSFVALLTVAMSGEASASQLYRYKDENGKIVLNRHIPPDAVPRGYDILNEKGRLVERVAPALTPEQIAARDAERARQALIEEQRLKQQAIDDDLLQVYGHPDAAVRILERRVQDIHRVLKVNKVQIAKTERRIMQAEEEAANAQRRGIAVPDEILQRIENFKNDIVNFNSEIAELGSERSKIFAEFEEIISRLETLTNKPASNFVQVKTKLNSEHATITDSAGALLVSETNAAKEETKSSSDQTKDKQVKVALNSERLQGEWAIVSFSGEGKKDKDSWLFEDDQFYQLSGGNKASPDLFTIRNDKIDLGYAKIIVEKFDGRTMEARMAGFTYSLKKK